MKRFVLGLGLIVLAGSVGWIARRLGSAEPESLHGAGPVRPNGSVGQAVEVQEVRAPVDEETVPEQDAPETAVLPAVEDRAALEKQFLELESDLAAQRSELFEERFETGRFEVVPVGAGPVRPERTFDGLDVEVSWRHGERDGEPVLEVVTLPVADYPDYYRRVAERNELRERIDDLLQRGR